MTDTSNKAAICADLLEQGSMLNRLSAILTLISLFALPCIALLPVTITNLRWVACTSTICGIVELFLAMRVRFDVALLRRIGNGLDLLDLDDALAGLGLRNSTCAPRPLEDRLRGCVRLLVWQSVAFVIQLSLVLIGSVVVSWPAT